MPVTKKLEAKIEEARKLGADWAKGPADEYELKHLARVQLTTTDGDVFDMGHRASSAYSGAERFYFVINPDQDGERGSAVEFWQARGFNECPIDAIVQAFAEGAQECCG